MPQPPKSGHTPGIASALDLQGINAHNHRVTDTRRNRVGQEIPSLAWNFLQPCQPAIVIREPCTRPIRFPAGLGTFRGSRSCRLSPTRGDTGRNRSNRVRRGQDLDSGLSNPGSRRILSISESGVSRAITTRGKPCLPGPPRSFPAGDGALGGWLEGKSGNTFPREPE